MGPTGAADPTLRFSGRVADYARYRPRYPAGLIEGLVERTGLQPAWIIADIGCGTGLSAEPFLEYGCSVYGVEPNAEMRAAATAALAGHARFSAIAGTAEATALGDHTVDMVVSGHAFHWFDTGRAVVEFRRILRPGGPIVVFWNTRKTGGSPQAEAFEALVQRFGTDYRDVRHDRYDGERMKQIFGGACDRFSIVHAQRLDFETLRGRLLSMSFLPGPGDPAREEMLRELAEMHDRFGGPGGYRLDYETEIYVAS